MAKVLASYKEEINQQKIPSGQKKVLLAGLKLFSEKGFHATTTAEIAHEASVSEGTIYKYFKSKDDLLTKLLNPLLKEVQENFFVQLNDYQDLSKLVAFVVEDRVHFLLINFDFFSLFFQELLTNQNMLNLIKKYVAGEKGVLAYCQNLQHRFTEINQKLTPVQILRILISPMLAYVIQVKLFNLKAADDSADMTLLKRQISANLTD
ncbi:TetR/AcrR family transcriptional regulator [Lactobacillus xylocopicola]|uniref:TetR family transcriptional regulator n=1 Tax=Lactobacillus xylocopicola TaxID=2976676 RepID=A0ABM8BFX7_9LACO|nr:helix-turn-helix domain-containing protein [Lactobacillus xylocopicola]BDR60157.1 TetR family transcriptional regulator [Lactobacillus xylocopicola]